MVEIRKPTEKYLWKFIDIYKFLNLIETRHLYFSPLNNFDDVYEYCGKELAYFLQTNRRTANMDTKKRNPNLESSSYDQKKWDILQIVENIKKDRKNLFVNCFFAASSESIAMWNLYSGIEGVAIRYSTDSLLEYISRYHKVNFKSDYFIEADMISYEKVINHQIYDSDGNIVRDYKRSPFVKDECYKYENEYRIIIKRRNDSISAPIISINDWDRIDFEIYVHTDLEDWKVSTITDILRKYDIKKEVRKSEIMTSNEINKYQRMYLEHLIENNNGSLRMD
jgi:hypothetical protein